MSERSATAILDFFHSSSKQRRVTDVAEKREMMTAHVISAYGYVLVYMIDENNDIGSLSDTKQHLTMHQVAQIPQGEQYLGLSCYNILWQLCLSLVSIDS